MSGAGFHTRLLPQIEQPLPKKRMSSDRALITYSGLVEDFKTLGVAPGQVVMLHASVKSVGKIVGGPNVIIQALLSTLTPTGTLMMYAVWEDMPDFISEITRLKR